MTNTVLEPTRSPSESLPARLPGERLVAVRVLQQLGRPRNLYRVNAEHLWGNQYRVNVYCTVDSERMVKSVRMTDSFFVTLTDQGLESDPPIVRRYE